MNDYPEELCRRCGRCCTTKLIVRDEVILTPVPCPHLDPDTKLCRVYERRFEVNPDCLTIERGIKMRVFPADCPYVAGLEGYRPPIPDWRESKYADLITEEFEGKETADNDQPEAIDDHRSLPST